MGKIKKWITDILLCLVAMYYFLFMMIYTYAKASRGRGIISVGAAGTVTILDMLLLLALCSGFYYAVKQRRVKMAVLTGIGVISNLAFDVIFGIMA